MCKTGSTIIPGHRYRNAPAAIEWLSKVFGFERHAVYEGENGSIAHAELTLGNGMIMLGSARDDEFGSGFRSPADLDGIETRTQRSAGRSKEALSKEPLAKLYREDDYLAPEGPSTIAQDGP